MLEALPQGLRDTHTKLLAVTSGICGHNFRPRRKEGVGFRNLCPFIGQGLSAWRLIWGDLRRQLGKARTTFWNSSAEQEENQLPQDPKRE